MYAVLLSAVLVLSCLCPLTVQQEDSDPSSYFAYEKDRTSGLSPRIIGGVEVKKHAYPFQAALMMFKGAGWYFCGGSLVSHNLVLTAAHCVGMKPDYIQVGLGYHNLSSTPEAVEMTTTDYVIHRNWNNETFLHDVALIRLPQNVTFNDYIKPVQLASGSERYAGDRATLLGWGQTELVVLSAVLKGVNATIMSNADCANTNVLYQKIIKSTHICTSGSGPIGVCSGDSGGPLVVNGVQVGITSFGMSDCSLGMPSGFTRVSEYYDWIARGGAPAFHGLHFTVIILIAPCLAYFFN